MALGFWGFSQKNRIFEQGSEPIELGAQGCDFVLIPKGLHNIAQGCHVFVATLGLDEIRIRTLKGFHRGKVFDVAFWMWNPFRVQIFRNVYPG